MKYYIAFWEVGADGRGYRGQRKIANPITGHDHLFEDLDEAIKVAEDLLKTSPRISEVQVLQETDHKIASEKTRDPKETSLVDKA